MLNVLKVSGRQVKDRDIVKFSYREDDKVYNWKSEIVVSDSCVKFQGPFGVDEVFGIDPSYQRDNTKVTLRHLKSKIDIMNLDIVEINS